MSVVQFPKHGNIFRSAAPLSEILAMFTSMPSSRVASPAPYSQFDCSPRTTTASDTRSPFSRGKPHSNDDIRSIKEATPSQQVALQCTARPTVANGSRRMPPGDVSSDPLHHSSSWTPAPTGGRTVPR